MVEHNSVDICLNIKYSPKPEGVRKVSVLVETLTFSLLANITFFGTINRQSLTINCTSLYSPHTGMSHIKIDNLLLY